jgi:Spy/CpxP family protein refolding chaperone
MSAVVVLAAANLWGADGPGKAGAGKAVKEGQPQTLWLNNARVGEGKSAATWYIESLDKAVGLTDAQKKAITEIFAAREKSVKDFQAQNAEKLKAASAALTEAYQKKDQEAIAKVQKAYQELYAPMHEIMKKSEADLTNVLTPPQQAKLNESRFMNMVKGMTNPVQLTDAQLQKIKAAYGELSKQGDHAGFERKLPQVIQQILTPEQKATIAKQRAMNYVKSMFNQAKLTDEQLKKVEAACDELIKNQTIKADWNWEAYKTLGEKINGLLTNEQKEAMKNGRMAGGFGAGGLAPGASLTPRTGAAGWQALGGSLAIQTGPRAGEYWLGLQLVPSAEATGQKLNPAPALGLVVQEVVPESPAAKAGLKPQDILLKAGQKPLKTVHDLMEAVQAAKETDLAIELTRDGKSQKITVRPAKRAMAALGTRIATAELFVLSEDTKPTLDVALPDDMAVTIVKSGKQPAKILVKQAGKSWEAGADGLSKLPDSVRPYVERMLGRGPLHYRLSGKIGAEGTAPGQPVPECKKPQKESSKPAK